MKISNKLDLRWLKYNKLGLHDKFYALGLIVFVAYFALSIAFSYLKVECVYCEIFVQYILVFVVFILGVVALSIHIFDLIKKYHTEFWFKSIKWIAGFLVVLVYTYSTSRANNFINEYVGVDPSLLPDASFALTLFFIVPAWLVFLGLIGVILIFIGGVASPLLPDIPRFTQWKIFHIIIITLGVILFSHKLELYLNETNSFANSLAKSIVRKTEYYNKSHCTNVFPNELSADIGRGYVSVYDERAKGEKFKTKKCELINCDEAKTAYFIKKNKKSTPPDTMSYEYYDYKRLCF